MTDKEIILDYLKIIRWIHAISGIIDVPMLVLIYWLGYKTGFGILLILFIINEFAFAIRVSQLEKRIDLE